MAEEQETVPLPARYSRVDPWVISPDTAAEISFLETAFGAVETPGSRMLDTAGRIAHVEVEIGDSVVMLFDAHAGWPPTPAHLRVYVADAGEVFDRAVAAGARAVTWPTELAFGERVARLRDPQGHLWWVHQRLADVGAAELARRLADQDAKEAMAYVQESLSRGLSGSR